MKTLSRNFFIAVLVLSSYHLLRDILQTFGVHNLFTNILHRPHEWCGPYCNYVTYPLDLLGIIGSWIVIRRDKIGLIGKVIILSLPLWLLAALLP